MTEEIENEKLETAVETVLFTLSDNEKAQLEAAETARANAKRNAAGELSLAEQRRREVFRQLIAKYPPRVMPNGLRIWRCKGSFASLQEPHPSDLDFPAYVEVALNGKYFDPRVTPRRDDLDVPQFSDTPTTQGFLRA